MEGIVIVNGKEYITLIDVIKNNKNFEYTYQHIFRKAEDGKLDCIKIGGSKLYEYNQVMDLVERMIEMKKLKDNLKK